tara:strand:- start:171 stop:392 length:222 start_codon:yes stop_codon:yes gene_type:complete
MVEIADFLNNVTTKNYSEAEKQFSALLNDRLADRLQSEKIKVAGQVFNNQNDEEIEEVELKSEEKTETEDEEL